MPHVTDGGHVFVSAVGNTPSLLVSVRKSVDGLLEADAPEHLIREAEPYAVPSPSGSNSQDQE